MARPRLFEDDAVRRTIRLPKHLERKVADRNLSTLLATTLDQYLSDRKLSDLVEDRESFRQTMDSLADEVKRLRHTQKRYAAVRKELSNLKRSITMTLREAVGEGRAKAMRLYRRCVDDLHEMDRGLAVIDAALRRADQGVGAA